MCCVSHPAQDCEVKCLAQVLMPFSSRWCEHTSTNASLQSCHGLFAGISAKQVQIILEDLRQEVERQSASGNNGIVIHLFLASPSTAFLTPSLASAALLYISVVHQLSSKGISVQCFVQT